MQFLLAWLQRWVATDHQPWAISRIVSRHQASWAEALLVDLLVVLAREEELLNSQKATITMIMCAKRKLRTKPNKMRLSIEGAKCLLMPKGRKSKTRRKLMLGRLRRQEKSWLMRRQLEKLETGRLTVNSENESWLLKKRK